MRFGDERSFTVSDNNRVRAIPKFAVDVDPDLEPDVMISEIVIVSMNGNQKLLDELIVGIRGTYVGAKYSVWRNFVNKICPRTGKPCTQGCFDSPLYPGITCRA